MKNETTTGQLCAGPNGWQPPNWSENIQAAPRDMLAQRERRITFTRADLLADPSDPAVFYWDALWWGAPPLEWIEVYDPHGTIHESQSKGQDPCTRTR